MGPLSKGQILFVAWIRSRLRIEYEQGQASFRFGLCKEEGWRRGFTAPIRRFRLQPIESVAAQELIGDLIALYRGMTNFLFPEVSYAFHKEISGLQGVENENFRDSLQGIAGCKK